MKTISSLLRQLIREQVTQLSNNSYLKIANKVTEGGNAEALSDRDPETGIAPSIKNIKTYKGKRVASAPIILYLDKGLSRATFKTDLLEMLTSLDNKFKEAYGEPLWDPSIRDEIFRSGKVFQGSSRNLFSDSIPDEQIFVDKDKPGFVEVGDVDLMIPRESGKKLFKMINLNDLEAGFPLTVKMKYMGHNKVSDNESEVNAIFLYEFLNSDSNEIVETFFQIDFNSADYEGGKPTDWEVFSRSASIEDKAEGISGVNHKYILEVIADLGNPPPIGAYLATPAATAENPKMSSVKLSGIKTLDVGGGYGSRYEKLDWQHNGNDVYKYLKRAERKDTTKIIKEIFIGLFPEVEPTEANLKDFESFRGVLEIIKREKNLEEIKKIYEEYIERLYGPSAQRMSATDPEKDRRKKEPSIEYFREKFPEVKELDSAIDALKSEFYGKYKIRSKNESVDYNNIKKFIKEVLRAWYFYKAFNKRDKI